MFHKNKTQETTEKVSLQQLLQEKFMSRLSYDPNTTAVEGDWPKPVRTHELRERDYRPRSSIAGYINCALKAVSVGAVGEQKMALTIRSTAKRGAKKKKEKKKAVDAFVSKRPSSRISGGSSPPSVTPR
ncbi:hypothetical protein AAG570_010730 [Ranatra chinensis]|uniref:Uncharacterized protein n=1 Tax=Ranatra chinensis TaxID=642074 RepID=A0ABD0Z5H0_9HEMI